MSLVRIDGWSLQELLLDACLSRTNVHTNYRIPELANRRRFSIPRTGAAFAPIHHFTDLQPEPDSTLLGHAAAQSLSLRAHSFTVGLFRLGVCSFCFWSATHVSLGVFAR